MFKYYFGKAHLNWHVINFLDNSGPDTLGNEVEDLDGAEDGESGEQAHRTPN